MRHSINLAPAAPALDADQLPELVAAYLADCSTRLSAVTVDSYLYALAYLLAYFGGDNLEITKPGLVAFGRWLERQPGGRPGAVLAFNTRAMVLARCRQLFRWAHTMGHIDRDLPFVPVATGAPPIRRAATLAGLQQLLAAASSSSKAARDLALLAVLIGTGIRRGECAALNVDDVILHADQSGRLLIRQTKTDNPRQVVFDRVTGLYLVAYLRTLGADTGPLFLGHGGRRLGVKGVYNVVKGCARRAGLVAEIQGPHDLRRLFVTVWMRHKPGVGSAQLLALQAGHTSPRMTLRYSLQTVDDIEADFLSPLGLIAPPSDVTVSSGT